MRRSRHLMPLVIVVAVFAVSRLLARVSGVEFDTSPLRYFWQYLDVPLLEHRLLQSLWNLHSQPPLYNLFLGLNLKVAGSHAVTVMHLEYVVLGLVFMVALYALFERVTGRRWLATVVAVIVGVSPTSLLYENWLFYEYPVTVALVGSLLALALFCARPTVLRGTVFFGLLAALVYTRATFQLPWLLLVGAVLLWALPGARRAILVSATIPLLVVVLLYAKNEAVFGIPTTSSWAGMNLAQIAYAELPPATRDRLVADGTLSSISKLEPFSDIEDYPGVLQDTRHTGIPALDTTRKEPLPGQPDAPVNFNNLAYVAISKDYQRDAIKLIEKHPGIYLAGVHDGLRKFFAPSSDNFFLARNRGEIGSWNTVFDQAVLWRFRSYSPVSILLVLAYLVAVLYGLVVVVELKRDRTTTRLPVLAVAWLTVVWVGLLTTFGEVAENERVRLCLDPLVLLLVVSAVLEVLPRFRRR